MSVYFRVDASAQIGLGHLVRCLALADEIAQRGVDCAFLLKERTESSQTLMNASAHRAIWMDVGENPSVDQDAHACLQYLVPGDYMVVDHYGLDARWERVIRQKAQRLLAIDDLADRSHDCELLVDPGYGRSAADYAGLLPAAAATCLGTAFAILKPEYAAFHAKAPAWPALRRAHVFLGGGAASRWLVPCVEAALRADPLLQICAIGQVDRQDMDGLLKEHGERLQWHSHVGHMAAEYALCDVAMGSPGTATWERACVGLPAAVFATAENQIPVLQTLEQLKFCRYLGAVWELDQETMVESMKNFLDDVGTLQELRAVGLRAVDGQGVRRIAGRLLYEGT